MSVEQIVHGVLPSGESRPVIVIKVLNPDDPSPTVMGNMHTLGRFDDCPELVVLFQGRYNPDEGSPGKFVPGTYHASDQSEPRKNRTRPEPVPVPVPPSPPESEAEIFPVVEEGRGGKSRKSK